MLGMAIDAKKLRHVREVRPLDFPSSEPEDEKMGEGGLHLRLLTFLWQILELAIGKEHSIGSEQFVYWNGRNPRRVCCPDVFVKLGTPNTVFETWKTWERGTPELAIEIVSPSDREAWSWDQKMERYAEFGVRELVLFDRQAEPGKRVRVWDRIDDDLVEREVEGDATPCLALRLYWVVRELEGLGPALRPARDREGRDLLPSPVEAERQKIAELEARLAQRDAR